MNSERPVSIKKIGGTAAVIIGTYLAVELLLGAAIRAGVPRLTLIEALAARVDDWPVISWYIARKDEIDIVYIGDSRSYCGISPSLLDPLTGGRSVNIASWVIWFPTQYAILKDILPRIPPGTTVVWSIGYQNFYDRLSIPINRYPLGAKNVARLFMWGFPFENLKDNLFENQEVLPLLAGRKTILDGLNFHLEKRLWPALNAASKADCETAPILKNGAHYRNYAEKILADSSVLLVRPWLEGETITSAEIIYRAGNSLRVEFEPDLFRMKQRELAAGLRLPENRLPAAENKRLKVFREILDLLDKYPVKLIVNEFEEAPYHYEMEEYRDSRKFMRQIRSEIENRGIPYIRVDWESFSDDDYFDWCHLNERGVKKFSSVFAAEMIPHLAHREAGPDAF